MSDRYKASLKLLTRNNKVTQSTDAPTTASAQNDNPSPHLPHMSLPPHGTLHCLAHICTWQDHHSWKALHLGSSRISLTTPLGRRYKASHPSYYPPETCLPKTSPMFPFPCHSPSMLFPWRLWPSTSHNSSGDLSIKALRLKISHPLPLHHRCLLPPHPWRKTILSLHMPHCRLPHPLYSQSG